jgi:hypothetical protein
MPIGTTALVLGSLAAAQTANSMVSDAKAAKGARKTANFQAGILEQQANDAIGIGDEAAGHAEAVTRGITGAQRASFGAQGVDLSSGSAADVIGNDQRLGQIEAQTIRNNAAREALGLKTQATLVRMGGANAAQGYKNAATGSLLSGASALYDTYTKFGLNRQNLELARANKALDDRGIQSMYKLSSSG